MGSFGAPHNRMDIASANARQAATLRSYSINQPVPHPSTNHRSFFHAGIDEFLILQFMSSLSFFLFTLPVAVKGISLINSILSGN